MSAHDPRHGSNAGYLAHYKGDHPTPPCRPCKDARAAYNRERRKLQPPPSTYCIICRHPRRKHLLDDEGVCAICADDVSLEGGRWVPRGGIVVWVEDVVA